MTMRRFTLEEEQGLLFLLGAEGARWRPLPAKCGPSTYKRLAAIGCAQLLQDGPMTKGRLTSTGRYFAELVSAAQKPIISMQLPPPVLQLDAIDGD